MLTSYRAWCRAGRWPRSSPAPSPSASFSATFTVTDQDRLATAVLTGPFYPQADDVTYTITFDDYGTAKHITAP